MREGTTCPRCDGKGLLIEAARPGYHLFKQCPVCKGHGTTPTNG